MPEDLVLVKEPPQGVVGQKCHHCGEIFYVWEDKRGLPMCEACYERLVAVSEADPDADEDKSPWEE